jgi:YebC/PmpR family DNA-binding regulatory protein
MSGHSKWSQIKRQKGAADAKRGVAFGKLANAIILAAKKGGGNPEANFSLKMAIEKAKTGLMPKENIERAIKRGTGEIAGAQIEEILYEAIGPAGISIIIEAATDNKNRTAPEIKNTLAKFGAKMASMGAATYQFEKKGKIIIDLKGQDKENIELISIDAGSDDFAEDGEDLAVFTKPNELEQVKKNLENQGLLVKEAQLIWEPKDTVVISDKVQEDKIIELLEMLENMDDVSAIFSNFDVEV